MVTQPRKCCQEEPHQCPTCANTEGNDINERLKKLQFLATSTPSDSTSTKNSPFYSLDSRRLCDIVVMAKPSLSTTLPRFLLPRLSWQATPVHHNTIRALSTLSTSYTPSFESSHTTASRPVCRAKHNACGQLKPSILANPAHHRAFRATARQSRDHHFDTLKFVQRLREEGFTEAQSVAMMKVLSDVIEERLAQAQIPTGFPKCQPAEDML